MDFDKKYPFPSEAKAKNFMGNTSWYTLSLVEILEQTAVAAWNTVGYIFMRYSLLVHLPESVRTVGKF